MLKLHQKLAKNKEFYRDAKKPVTKRSVDFLPKSNSIDQSKNGTDPANSSNQINGTVPVSPSVDAKRIPKKVVISDA